jgi:hypothetical protein
MPDCPASCQSGTGLKITNDAVNCPVPEENDAVRHFFIRYRTGMTDAGMPMPALVFRMSMPPMAIRYTKNAVAPLMGFS